MDNSGGQKGTYLLREAWWAWRVYALSAVVIALLLFVPRQWVVANTSHVEGTPYYLSITVLRLWIRIGTALLGIFCFVMLCVVERQIRDGRHRGRRTLTFAIALLLLLSPVWRVWLRPRLIIPWRICDKVLGSDGNIYCYMNSSFMMADMDAITRLAVDGWFAQTFDVLQENFGDGSSWRWIVRPAEVPPTIFRTLYVSEAGFIVGIRGHNAYHNKCSMAYDVNNKRAFGSGNMDELSPFVLIGGETSLNQSDAEDVLLKMEQAVSAGKKGKARSGYVKTAILEKELLHENQEVRKLAGEMLDMLDERKEQSENAGK